MNRRGVTSPPAAKIVQDGYPTHERALKSIGVDGARGTKDVSPCFSALALPEQGGAEMPTDALYCTGCKVFLVVEYRERELAERMARAEGFNLKHVATKPIDPPAPRTKLDAAKVTVPMFAELKPRLRPDGRAR